MPQGARLGSATVIVGGRPVATVPLVLAQAVPAVGSLTLAARFITQAADVGADRRPRFRGRASVREATPQTRASVEGGLEAA